jgi:predicted metal-dependent hydrolase
MVKKRILGSFSSHTNTIWINPMLDRKNIPGFYVRYIVFHEMLHSIIKEEAKNGRRSPHSRAFRQRERQFGEYERAMEWEKKYFTANLRDAYHKI